MRTLPWFSMLRVLPIAVLICAPDPAMGQHPAPAVSIAPMAAQYGITGAQRVRAQQLMDAYRREIVPIWDYEQRQTSAGRPIVRDSVAKATRLRIRMDEGFRALMTPAMQRKFDSAQAANGAPRAFVPPPSPYRTQRSGS